MTQQSIALKHLHVFRKKISVTYLRVSSSIVQNSLPLIARCHVTLSTLMLQCSCTMAMISDHQVPFVWSSFSGLPLATLKAQKIPKRPNPTLLMLVSLLFPKNLPVDPGPLTPSHSTKQTSIVLRLIPWFGFVPVGAHSGTLTQDEQCSFAIALQKIRVFSLPRLLERKRKHIPPLVRVLTAQPPKTAAECRLLRVDQLFSSRTVNNSARYDVQTHCTVRLRTANGPGQVRRNSGHRSLTANVQPSARRQLHLPQPSLRQLSSSERKDLAWTKGTKRMRTRWHSRHPGHRLPLQSSESCEIF